MITEAYNAIHDILLEKHDEPTRAMITDLYAALPDVIVNDAATWGWSDTQVREDIYEYAFSFNKCNASWGT